MDITYNYYQKLSLLLLMLYSFIFTLLKFSSYRIVFLLHFFLIISWSNDNFFFLFSFFDISSLPTILLTSILGFPLALMWNILTKTTSSRYIARFYCSSTRAKNSIWQTAIFHLSVFPVNWTLPRVGSAFFFSVAKLWLLHAECFT